jgi:hypothetical protein
MIWGKTAKACATAGGMDNGVPIDSVGGSAREPVNLEDTEEHDARSSFSKQTGSSICRQLFSSQQDSTHTEVSSLQEARGGW